MNPFDLPPSGTPVDAPRPDSRRSGRGRTALVAILTVGLVGGGIAGISQLASADRPDLAVGAADDSSDDTIAPADETAGETADETTGDVAPADDPGEPESEPGEQSRDGQIVLDDGDGEPVVIDLGDVDLGRIGDLTECLGLPSFEGPTGEITPGMPDGFPFDLDELLGDLPADLDGLVPDGGSVTVVGPDGASVVDLGENGSVTVTSEDGEITVSTEGDATVSDLDDLLGEFGAIFESGDFGRLFDDEMLDDVLGSLPGDGSGFEPIDPDAVQVCIDEALGN